VQFHAGAVLAHMINVQCASVPKGSLVQADMLALINVASDPVRRDPYL
jgi:hypothetical protein